MKHTLMKGIRKRFCGETSFEEAAEVAFHNEHEMFFTCDDTKAQVADLRKKRVQADETSEERGALAPQSGFRATAPSGYISRNILSRVSRIPRKRQRDRPVHKRRGRSQ